MEKEQVSSHSFSVFEPRLSKIDFGILQPPKHLLIIPDGHRRWARQNSEPYETAYQKASEQGLCFVNEFLVAKNTNTLSFFLIAKHTMHRKAKELLSVFDALNVFLKKLIIFYPSIYKIEIYGDSNILPLKTQQLVQKIKNNFSNNTNADKILILLVGYSGTECKLKGNTISKHLKDEKIDLVFRAGGDNRLSDAPIIETGGSILIVAPKYFPDIDRRIIKTVFDIIDIQATGNKAFSIDSLRHRGEKNV